MRRGGLLLIKPPGHEMLGTPMLWSLALVPCFESVRRYGWMRAGRIGPLPRSPDDRWPYKTNDAPPQDPTGTLQDRQLASV